MANQFTGTTFSGIYKDDYSDSDGYHKILFNSGRHIQGRELNQLQTILQKQVSRMASNIFMDGAAVNPKSSGAGTDVVDYVIVDSLNLTAGVLVSSYIGKIFKGEPKTGTLGVRFQISHVVDATGTDGATLYGRYISANQEGVSTEVQANTPVFEEGEQMTADDGSGLASLTVTTQPAGSTIGSIGKGCLFSMQSAEFYTQSHFVHAPKQTLAIGKYTGNVDAEVGFVVVQDIVTTEDDDALYDNQGSRPNLSSPGADRYRIRMILAVRPEEGDESDFVTFATVKSSEIIQIKEGTDNFNQIEKRLADRHADTHGNFIVNDFDLQFREGDDSANMVYSVPAMQEGITPTAFLDGFHLEHQIPAEFLSPKPVSFVTEQNASLNAEYKNYVSLGGFNQSAKDSALGSFGATATALGRAKRLQLINKEKVKIGYTRLKSIIDRGTADSDAYRMHLYDTVMIGSYNFRDTHRIAPWDQNVATLPSGSEGAYPVKKSGNAYLEDPTSSTALFQIPGGRVKSITPTEITVQRFVEATVASDLTITVTCQSDEDMVDTGQWIFVNDTQNVVDPIPSGNIGSGTTSRQITTTGTVGDTIYVYFYVQKNAPAARSKTYTVVTATATRTSSGDPAGDVFEFTNLYDGVELISAGSTDGDATDFTHLVEFDGGQRDNYYGPIVLRPDGIDASVTTISAEFAMFVHGTNGDFFSVDSYIFKSAANATAAEPIFGYEDIPDFKSRTSGAEYQLHNMLDFRPQLDPNANEMLATQSFEMPIDGAKVNYTVEFYNNRIDHVALTYSSDFKVKLVVNKGIEAQQPVPPNEKINQMVLFDVMMSGKTKSVEDMGINRRTYRGYKMRDINQITKRVAQLEETISLSALENEASNLIEFGPPPTNVVRSKTGFFVDDFSKGYAFAASFLSNEFVDDASFATSSLDDGNNTIHSRLGLEHVEFIHDDTESVLPATRRPAGNKDNVVVKGDLIMLDHINVLDTSLKQEMISWKGGAALDYEEDGYYNVNPFNVFLGEGILRLNPARDTWFDTVRLPDKQNPAQLVIRQVGKPLIPRTTTFSRTSVVRSWRTNIREKIPAPQAGPGWFRWGRLGVQTVTVSETQTFRTTQKVRNEIVDDQSITRVIGDERIATMSVPFMRQRRVFASAEGLRPNTRYWCFMGGIDMAQWVRNVDKGVWQAGIRNNLHRQRLSTSNVGIRRHPFATSGQQVLMTDSRGELYFELWIPNNARVSIPLSSQYNTEQEWKKWQADNRRLSKQFGSKSVRTLNGAGWKFRCGTQVVKLLDISVDKEVDALSKARSTYTAAGSVALMQRTLQTTRTISFKNVLEDGEPQLIGTQNSTAVSVQWRDPLAQSFTIDAGQGVAGVFVTQVEVFLHKAPKTSTNGGNDLAVPLELQIRGMKSGIPDANTISDQHRVFMTADSAYESTYKTISGEAYDLNNHAKVLARPVTMKLKEPVYLRSGEEYAIVLLAETDNYEAYVATTYDLVLGSNSKRVNKQPSKGSLFLSQNGSTWTPKQNQDMAFRIYTAKFKKEGKTNFYSTPLESFVHNSPQALRVSEDSNGDLRRILVTHGNHGMGAGDLVSMKGLPTGTYRGVSSTVIQNATNEVSQPSSNSYFIDLNGQSATFTSRGLIGRDSVESNRGFPIDRAMLNFQEMEVGDTGIEYAASFVSGLSHVQVPTSDTNDPRFVIDTTATPMGNGESLFFGAPKYLGNADQENTEIDTQGDSSPSIVVGAILTTDQTSKFGQPTAAQMNSGYVSDVSPIIDTQSINMVVTNNIIDNQVMSDAEAPVLWTTNKPGIYAPETHPTLGSSPSKHITKIVQLAQGSSGLKIMVDMYVPPAASFDVYYRTGVALDEDLYQKNWILATKQNNPPKSVWVADEDSMSFTEHRYLVGGETGDLPEFLTFQVKVVFKTTNTCQSPVMESIRCIALAG